MPYGHRGNGALSMGALFRCSGWTGLLASAALAAGLLGAPQAPAADALARSAQCASAHYDESARVSYVYDGDTVRLADGRRVRLIGVDTPETGKHGKPSEPYADEAKSTLRAWLKADPRVHLRYDRTRHDHYGRVLAHVFLADGTSVTARLLRAGLGTALVIPPNTWHYRCYARAEAAARQAKRRIWSLAKYRPMASTRISRRARGFHIVTGRVDHVGKSRRSLWLDLSGHVSLFIPRDHLRYFPDLEPQDLVGRRVEARGWLHYHKGSLIMRVLHPAALRVARRPGATGRAH